MKRVFMTSMVLLAAFPVVAQLPLLSQKKIDSFYIRIRSEHSDSLKSILYSNLFYFTLSFDREKALKYLDTSRTYARNYPFLAAVSYGHEGYFYFALDKQKTEGLFLKCDSALSHLRTKEAYAARTNIWGNIAAIKQERGEDRKYMDIILNKAIPLALQSGKPELITAQYTNAGLAFMNTKQYEKAETYFNKAIRSGMQIAGEPSRIVAAYNRAGENYMYLKKYEKARAVLDTVAEILLPFPHSELYARHYLVEGIYRQHQKQFDWAEQSFDKGIAAARGPDKADILFDLKTQKIKTLLSNKKYKQVLQILEPLYKDTTLMQADVNRLEVYNGYAKAYAGTGAFEKAYTWSNRYNLLHDSVARAALNKEVNELEIQYQTADQERKIAELEADKHQSELKEKNATLNNRTWFAIRFTLITTLFYLMFYYRNRRKRASLQLKEMEQKQQLATAEAMLEGEERERRRVARDLHDGLGGLLAAIKIKLSGHARAENSTRKDLDKVIEQLDYSVAELRRIARNMMPESLVRVGLNTSLSDLCESLSTGQTQISYEAIGIDGHIELSTQIIIYRIIQEALSNAIRHADAKHILLQCSQNGDTFFITVEDDGKGFDKTEIAQKKGLGLSNIENRVKYLKGKLEIETKPNEGTTINVELNMAA